MTQTEATTVRKQIVVDAPIEHAFTVFTDRFGDFKPPEHNLLGAPIAATVFEPRVGGHIVDRATDGSECRWARILAFDPPDRVIFSWDISPRWAIETDPAQTSEVEVRFYAESPTRTRVELEHRHIDRHGPGWEAVTGGVDGPEGWPLYLDRYAALAKEGSLPAADRHQRRHRSRVKGRKSGRMRRRRRPSSLLRRSVHELDEVPLRVGHPRHPDSAFR
jgi:uncharacterized protein YndB with AHSA1/START domain